MVAVEDDGGAASIGTVTAGEAIGGNEVGAGMLEVGTDVAGVVAAEEGTVGLTGSSSIVSVGITRLLGQFGRRMQGLEG